ncbi:MAG: TldD protein [Halieaceae bacterium]|jgi:TldD protein
MNNSESLANSAIVGDYSEIREHQLQEIRMVFVDGNLTVNRQSSEGGSSVRIFDQGYWGFASTPRAGEEPIAGIWQKASANAKALSRFGEKQKLLMPDVSYRGEHPIAAQPRATTKEFVALLEELHVHCAEKYPSLISSKFMIHDEFHSKHLRNSFGSDVLNCIDRASVYMTFIMENEHGKPVDLTEVISGKGGLADLDLSAAVLEPKLAQLFEHLQAKRYAVPVKGGEHTIVISPELAGMLAHEAMGHPCEADIVLGGAVTGNLMGERVASDHITMIDFAHSYEGAELLIPVYADDEGTPGKDALLIENGILKEFMNSRETAGQLGVSVTGNARGFNYNDEPLVRMRNTAILPGKDKLEDMIAGVERGYYLVKTGNGQADSTTEFMFGIDLGYEIRDGKLGSAIADTTVSGTAINMLQTVDAVSDDMVWSCSGYCGKKQPMVVSMGGPALRGRAHLGGE